MSRRSTDSTRFSLSAQWNRALSFRSSNRSSNGTTASTTSSHHSTSTASRKPFSFHSLRGTTQPPLSKRLYRLIKSANTLVSAHETAARERLSIATQLSEWGDQSSASSPGQGVGGGDAAVSDISDKIGVLLSELGEQEEVYASRLDESRGVLKVVRNTERSVQPSREGKRRVAEEIQRLKIKEPQSTRLVTLEQELVRAEAENLVAEAQLGNVTRQKLKEAYTVDFLATIERAEKQAILARHGLRLLQLLDDTPVVPGDVRPQYAHASQARQILNDAEDDLREWRLDGGFVGDDKTVVVGDGSEQQHAMPKAAEEKGKQKEKLKNREVDRGSVEGTEGDGLSAKY
ncbi:Eisosome component PIL1-domain-containing protein [Parachaetomium inaequale]|uniref:Eisosome component PIL1-domain-containing protein n=1 Tax=Parachaetomium inaequale TaxID=2588326 RepID=A0AAN6SNE0_9PEZI|nr:Eisosome component PIL1-domain-containing protein [Parachaetomium inaequale]